MKRRKEKPIKIGTSCREILQRNKLILAAFCLPVILMLLAFLVMGIYPAGENQIAVIDMYHQYVPFLGELQEKLQSRGITDIKYRLVKEIGPDHDKTFIVQLIVNGRPVTKGRGKSKKQAEQQAAEEMMEREMHVL